MLVRVDPSFPRASGGKLGFRWRTMIGSSPSSVVVADCLLRALLEAVPCINRADGGSGAFRIFDSAICRSSSLARSTAAIRSLRFCRTLWVVWCRTLKDADFLG